MWTERERILCRKKDIEEYLASVDYFHDYRLGYIEFCESANKLTIEEDTRSLANEDAHIWDFTFVSISNLKITVDFIPPAYITEIKIKNDEVVVELNNGCISFNAVEIKLGIPTQ